MKTSNERKQEKNSTALDPNAALQIKTILVPLDFSGASMHALKYSIALMQERLAEVQEKHGVKFWPDNCHVVSGRPYVEICKLARELGVDLIVLPTRGHSGLKHLALGSTAERTRSSVAWPNMSCGMRKPQSCSFPALKRPNE